MWFPEGPGCPMDHCSEKAPDNLTDGPSPLHLRCMHTVSIEENGDRRPHTFCRIENIHQAGFSSWEEGEGPAAW